MHGNERTRTGPAEYPKDTFTIYIFFPPLLSSLSSSADKNPRVPVNDESDADEPEARRPGPGVEEQSSVTRWPFSNGRSFLSRFVS